MTYDVPSVKGKGSAQQTVITMEQARKITGGRTPLVPVEYEAAVKALAQCVVIDEAKTWSDKADALAAWAKIYRDDAAGRQARILKLHAYRRMGQIARELRPHRVVSGRPGPGPLLQQQGLTHAQARDALAVSRIPERDFKAATRKERPPSPTTLRQLHERPNTSESWQKLTNSGTGWIAFRSFCQKNSAAELADGLARDEALTARLRARELREWLLEFDQHLPVKAEG